MKRLLKIAVVCGGPSSEHEVSLHTANMVLKNLNRREYKPTLVTIGKNEKWKFGARKEVSIGNALENLRNFDFVFIAMHGPFGEDGRIQGILEWIGVPYSGSGVLSSAMAMDKQVSNALYQANGLTVPYYTVINKTCKKILLPFLL